MRPSDREIRDELRREAAQVPIPKDLWKNIERELDRDRARAERRERLQALRAQWAPAMAFAAAAGIFWLTVVPISIGMEYVAQPEGQVPAVTSPLPSEEGIVGSTAEAKAQQAAYRQANREERRSPYDRFIRAADPFTAPTRY